ncbi:esterase/lipase family protein [Nocardioides perillae]|uniref:Triacylglycerol esterase/lipase EstA (Alpha/beta hydrolase family) n=1 Tax=Nocardioides perillae TaxID=1119534 RepID=A0A7Y9RXA6_9ACTN|nr:lipase [Nocardioides perillae]NYG56258.1 triacylglycerol esterase/lipase EstA (alpha/beta hydrolase family) [Nocardioides perillae]
MLDSLAPARRRTVLGAAALAAVLVVAALTAVVLVQRADRVDPVAQDRLGPVLLVPGYGGATGGLERLAASLQVGGRRTQVVRPSAPTGDLRAQAAELGEVVDRLLAAGAPSVDVVGYSAGGVVVRWWVEELGGASQARRVVTLASPHAGTDLAALGAGLGGDACPEACRQLAPDSDLLRRLPVDDVAEGPRWTAVWTEDDRTVVPPDSGRLAGPGVLSYSLQSVCPGLVLGHAEVPAHPVVAAAVEAALGTPAPTPPDPAVCDGPGAGVSP